MMVTCRPVFTCLVHKVFTASSLGETCMLISDHHYRKWVSCGAGILYILPWLLLFQSPHR